MMMMIAFITTHLEKKPADLSAKGKKDAGWGKML